MPKSGRSVLLLGRRMVINLNNRGGVRKSPGTNWFASCVGQELHGKSGRTAFFAAVKTCKGRGRGG